MKQFRLKKNNNVIGLIILGEMSEIPRPDSIFAGIHNLSIGNRVNIAQDCFLQASGGLTLEDEVMLGPGVKIWTVNHKIDDVNVPILDQGHEAEEVVIGKGCWLAANVFIMPGVHLPEGCVVAANSVVAKKKYPPFSILAGFPARKIGTRLKEDAPSPEGSTPE